MPDTVQIRVDAPEVEKDNQTQHIPSTVQADTLFHFERQLDWIINPLRLKMLSPRYCTENISYLEVDGIKNIAYPMKCFCDINLHRMGVHLEWYGYYGIAFTKEWGMKQKIQPVQYINPDSEFRKDLTVALTAALDSVNAEHDETCDRLANYLLHHLMYCKPYSGEAQRRTTGQVENKCFTDECEWRFVPDITTEGYWQVIFDEAMLRKENLDGQSKAMEGLQSISLNFEYSDIKYIIIEKAADLPEIIAAINGFQIEDMEKYSLISKIIIWENSKEDF